VSRRFFSRCLLLFTLLALPTPLYAYSRIVSLKPNLTEILFALGVGPQVVGDTKYCTRPEAARNLPKVADYLQAFPEEILKLKPDLIVGTKENGSQKEIQFLLGRGLSMVTLGSAENSSPKEVALLKAHGLDVDRLGFATLEQTQNSILALGVLLGREPSAESIVAKMRAELSALRREAEAVPKRRVLFVVGYQPLVVAGGDNFFDEAGTYIGAVNVVHESRLKYPYYTTELLIRAAPEVVLDFAMGSEVTPAARQSRQDFWKQFSSIPAVKNGQIFELDIDKMRAVPTLPETLREIFKLLHPS